MMIDLWLRASWRHALVMRSMQPVIRFRLIDPTIIVSNQIGALARGHVLLETPDIG
jgi:hypothetical protein